MPYLDWGVLKKEPYNPIKGHFPGGNVWGIRATTSIAAAIDTLISIELPFYVVLREDLKTIISDAKIWVIEHKKEPYSSRKRTPEG